jgi:hypothetical protein
VSEVGFLISGVARGFWAVIMTLIEAQAGDAGSEEGT